MAVHHVPRASRRLRPGFVAAEPATEAPRKAKALPLRPARKPPTDWAPGPIRSAPIAPASASPRRPTPSGSTSPGGDAIRSPRRNASSSSIPRRATASRTWPPSTSGASTAISCSSRRPPRASTTFTTCPTWSSRARAIMAAGTCRRRPRPRPRGWPVTRWPPSQLAQGLWKQLPEATVVEIQARGEFERFDPMEVIATAEETRQLVAACPEPYLVFPEDRKHPIRMTRDLPLRWIENGPAAEFRGTADRNEYYAFQVGLYAARGPVEDVAVEFGDLRADGGARDSGRRDDVLQPGRDRLARASVPQDGERPGRPRAGPVVRRGRSARRRPGRVPRQLDDPAQGRPGVAGRTGADGHRSGSRRPRRRRAVAPLAAAMAQLDDRHRRRGRPAVHAAGSRRPHGRLPGPDGRVRRHRAAGEDPLRQRRKSSPGR